MMCEKSYKCNDCRFCKVSPNPLMFENSLTDKREILYNITCEKENKILIYSVRYKELKSDFFIDKNI
jgi:hypothetical protein